MYPRLLVTEKTPARAGTIANSTATETPWTAPLDAHVTLVGAAGE
eukprot:CAMPEP_0206162568 /NCGR_PEP_ID=MMETSP1474-20131121/10200_1 /ASSEMBLY_ACC=CAM_ASM_001110 /TAXON_ID=97495 /ORGANISM="Imantonia sp., Strain RCC918" /LENGTH=44 /DNA_ID= /DNA_START= /DNA_END= /DNA_ORIENTATION=